MVKLYVQSLRGSYGPSTAGSGLKTPPMCCPFNFAQRILQNYDSKMFSLLFREHMGFLTRSVIYIQPGTRPIRSHPINYLLQYKYTSGNLNFRFFLRCRVSEILTCNLQPATCNLQPAVYTVRSRQAVQSHAKLMIPDYALSINCAVSNTNTSGYLFLLLRSYKPPAILFSIDSTLKAAPRVCAQKFVIAY